MTNKPYYLSLVLAVMMTMASSSCTNEAEENQFVRTLAVEYRSIESVEDIAAIQDSLVRPVIYNQAISLNRLPVEIKKEKFIHMILPSILYTNYKIDKIKSRVEEIEEKMVALDSLAPEDQLYLEKQLQQFKASDIAELKDKLVVHPVSITLAQAALESGWGSSRFFLEGNNIFGIWSYNDREQRIQALHGRDGNPIYVRKYDHISGSIEDYYKTIARVGAYKGFRKKRLETDNAYEIIPYLHRYSELGDEYVARLRMVIAKNNLTRFDSYQLDPSYFVETEVSTLMASIR